MFRVNVWYTFSGAVVGIGGRVPARILARGHIVRVVIGVLGLLPDQRRPFRYFAVAVVGVRCGERFLVQLDPVEIRVVADTAEGHSDTDLVVVACGCHRGAAVLPLRRVCAKRDRCRALRRAIVQKGHFQLLDPVVVRARRRIVPSLGRGPVALQPTAKGVRVSGQAACHVNDLIDRLLPLRRAHHMEHLVPQLLRMRGLDRRLTGYIYYSIVRRAVLAPRREPCARRQERSVVHHVVPGR